MCKLDIEIDTEELEALIDFQRSMFEGAVESCEYEESRRRRARIKQLEKFR